MADELTALQDERFPGHYTGGALLRDLERPNWIAPSVPEIRTDGIQLGIPGDAFACMTRVGSDANPNLLLDSRFVAQYETAPIPVAVELIPNEQRIIEPNDPRFPR